MELNTGYFFMLVWCFCFFGVGEKEAEDKDLNSEAPSSLSEATSDKETNSVSQSNAISPGKEEERSNSIKKVRNPLNPKKCLLPGILQRIHAQVFRSVKVMYTLRPNKCYRMKNIFNFYDYALLRISFITPATIVQQDFVSGQCSVWSFWLMQTDLQNSV